MKLLFVNQYQSDMIQTKNNINVIEQYDRNNISIIFFI